MSVVAYHDGREVTLRPLYWLDTGHGKGAPKANMPLFWVCSCCDRLWPHKVVW